MNSFVGYVDAALARRGTRTIARAWNMLALRRGEVEGVCDRLMFFVLERKAVLCDPVLSCLE